MGKAPRGKHQEDVQRGNSTETTEKGGGDTGGRRELETGVGGDGECGGGGVREKEENSCQPLDRGQGRAVESSS